LRPGAFSWGRSLPRANCVQLGRRGAAGWLAASVCVVLLVACQQQPELESFGAFPDVTLVDQSGVSFTTQQLGGRAALVNFVYTRCTEACPVLSATMARVQQRLTESQMTSRVMLVSVSVDPIHDSPTAMAEYGAKLGANAAGWKFLTGEWDQVYDLVTGLKLAARPPRPAAGSPPPGGSEISHTTRVILVDGQGQVRAYLRGDESSPDEMLDAVKRVLR
jgi:protein SCO1